MARRVVRLPARTVWNEKAYKASKKGNPNHASDGKFTTSATHGPDKPLDHKDNSLEMLGKAASAGKRSDHHKTLD